MLSNLLMERVEDILRSSLRHKLTSYKPEPGSMPFHTRLLGKDRLALYSFIHSLNTNFGTTIFEPIASEIASSDFDSVSSHATSGEKISEQAQHEIQRIMNSLIAAEAEPNKLEEIERIRSVCQRGEMVNLRPPKVDLMLRRMNDVYLFDIRTAKPNVGNFKEFKRMLLEWVAVMLAEKPDLIIHTAIAIPYNPYAPEPYHRWTLRGLLDLKHELFVAEQFWDFLGGDGAYEQLLYIFERIGIELRQEIDNAFSKFK